MPDIYLNEDVIEVTVSPLEQTVFTVDVLATSSGYTLPPATVDTLGGIKVGSNLTVTEDGTLIATGGSGIHFPEQCYIVTGHSVEGAPDATTQATIDQLLADGITSNQILWRNLGGTPTPGTGAIAGISATTSVAVITGTGASINDGYALLSGISATTAVATLAGSGASAAATMDYTPLNVTNANPLTGIAGGNATITSTSQKYVQSNGGLVVVAAGSPSVPGAVLSGSDWLDNNSGTPVYTSKTAIGSGYRYASTSGSPLAILCEPASTNLFQRSQDFANSYWSKQAVTIATSTVAAPDGTSTSTLMYPSSSGNSREVYRAVSSKFISIYARALGKNILGIGIIDTLEETSFFDLSTGTATKGTNHTAAWMTDIGNGWYRCVAYVPASSYTIFGVFDTSGSLAVTASGTNGILIWGAQGENIQLTSYIPTTTTTVARNVTYCTAAVVPKPGAQLKFDLNVESFNKDGADGYLLCCSSTLYLRLYAGVLSFTDGTTTMSYTWTPTLHQTYRIGLKYAAGDWALSIDETDVATAAGSAVTWPTPPKIGADHTGSTVLHGYISLLRSDSAASSTWYKTAGL